MKQRSLLILLAVLTVVAVLFSPAARADPVRAAQFADLIKEMRQKGFTITVSDKVPELYLPQQRYSVSKGGGPYTWLDQLEGGRPVRYQITTPSGKTKAVIYALRIPGTGDEINPQEIAHMAHRLNFGVSNYIGPGWQMQYPEIDSFGRNRDTQIFLGNIDGLLYRPDPNTLKLPTIKVEGVAFNWREVGLNRPALRNSLTLSEWSWDEPDGAWVNNNNEKLVFPGERDPYEPQSASTDSEVEIFEIDDPEFKENYATTEQEVAKEKEEAGTN